MLPETQVILAWGSYTSQRRCQTKTDSTRIEDATSGRKLTIR